MNDTLIHDAIKPMPKHFVIMQIPSI
uniref:Uncharacterized protein n=1 Tax=Anguilla anguilla TaxID=7936 RepID=A0A0E9QJE2_ANGAN